jgi:FlaA1/EpsC-like NDP-sugar epimerase
MKYKIRRLRKYAVLGLADIFLLLASWELAYYINGQHLWAIGDDYPRLWAILLAVALQVGLFIYTRLYRISLKQVSLELVYQGGLPLAIGGFLVLILMFTQTEGSANVLHILLPYWAFSILAIFSYRVVLRISGGYTFIDTNHINLPRTILYGGGSVGDQLLRLYRKDQLEYKIVGVLDDDPNKHRMLMHGMEVYGGVEALEDCIKKLSVKAIIIASVKIEKDRINEILDIAARYDVAVKIVPSLFEIEEDQANATELRDINVNDLLGREPIVIDKTPIIELVEGKVVLITGAGGSIGSEIANQILGYNPKQVLILDIDETEIHNLSLSLNNYAAAFSNTIIPIVCDVRDAQKIDRIMQEYEPQVIFHAAAYKHVPLMEYFPEEAMRTNIVGTYNVMTSAVKAEAERCILISTDKAVNPTNIMGATKRMAELIGSACSNGKTEIVAVRFGNVLGSRGSMLPLFLDQIQRGLPITVTHKEIIRYFMTIPEAVSLVFLSGAVAKGGEIMVLDMGKPVNIYKFAQKLVNRFGKGKSRVVVTGLRPGEKLYEELLTNEDTAMPTSYDKVFKAKVSNGHDIQIIKRFVDEIVSKEVENEHLIDTLCSYVPCFDAQMKIRKEA